MAKLGEVEFLQVNAESEDGEILADRYGVRSYPTFVAVNAAGDVIDRWVGYGGVDTFVTKVDTSIADPTTVPEKVARFDAEPSAGLAACMLGAKKAW